MLLLQFPNSNIRKILSRKNCKYHIFLCVKFTGKIERNMVADLAYIDVRA